MSKPKDSYDLILRLDSFCRRGEFLIRHQNLRLEGSQTVFLSALSSSLAPEGATDVVVMESDSYTVLSKLLPKLQPNLRWLLVNRAELKGLAKGS